MNKTELTNQITALQAQLRQVEIEEAQQKRIAKETVQRAALKEIELIMERVKLLIKEAQEIADNTDVEFDLSDSNWGLTNVPGISEDWNSSNCY